MSSISQSVEFEVPEELGAPGSGLDWRSQLGILSRCGCGSDGSVRLTKGGGEKPLEGLRGK